MAALVATITLHIKHETLKIKYYTFVFYLAFLNISLIRDTRECARLFALKTVHGLHPHARSGKREKSGDTSSRAASQPSSRVGCGASDFCKKCGHIGDRCDKGALGRARQK